jgi:hypothetical protein
MPIVMFAHHNYRHTSLEIKQFNEILLLSLAVHSAIRAQMESP